MTSSDPQRTVLPMPERQHVGLTRYCRTPAFERLADQGLKFTRFHTTALCSSSATSRLDGTVKWVQLDAGGDHLITPEERIRVATAVQ
jgi:arylsulfatase A-like enzyme